MLTHPVPVEIWCCVALMDSQEQNLFAFEGLQGIWRGYVLSHNCEEWMGMCWGASSCYSVQFIVMDELWYFAETHTHLLCVLLLCLASLLHLARLFENQTCKRQTIISRAERLNLWFGMRILVIKNEDSTLMVSSGSFISADSFSLVYISAYWLWENSDLGEKERLFNCFSEWKNAVLS